MKYISENCERNLLSTLFSIIKIKILKNKADSQRLFQIFFQHRKLYGADFEDPAVEFFQVEIIAKFFLAGCFQIKEVKVSPVVFQIISRGFQQYTGRFHLQWRRW